MNNTEIWRDINYKNVCPDMYEVSNLGNVRNKKTQKILHGNNIDNEKGYVRVCLQTTGKPNKFSVHRLVMYAFSDNPSYELEVNHIDCNPSNNRIENLEYTTRLENAHHASVNLLYQSCEDHHKSHFTNEEVHKICECFSKGYSIPEVIKYMGFDNTSHNITYLHRIKNRITWKNISCLYEWDDDKIRYKTYDKSDIELMCKYLFVDGYKPSHIVELFPEYDAVKLRQVLKKIKQKKLYLKISSKYF